MRYYATDGPPPDRAIAADRARLLRSWRSTTPAASHLVEQIALFWLEDDRRELRRALPADQRWMVDAYGD
jgi:hypothetical protein